MKWLSKFFSNILPKKETSADKAFRFAVIALAYYKDHLKENPQDPGFCIKLEGTKHSVTIL